MKDIEKLKMLFDEFGIEYDEVDQDRGRTSIKLNEGNEKVGGYCGFVAQFDFNDGAFEKVDIYE